MKKISFLFFLIISTFALAQVTFTPGIRAGANFAKFTETDGGFYDIFESTELWEDEEREFKRVILQIFTSAFLGQSDFQKYMLCNRKSTIPDKER